MILSVFRNRQRLGLILLLLITCGVQESQVMGQTEDSSTSTTQASAQSENTTSSAPKGFFDIVFSGGPTGFLIVMVLVALSIVAVALVIEHAISLRASVLMPPGLAGQVQTQILAGQPQAADAVCNRSPSFLSFILSAGIAELDGGPAAVEKAVEDAAAGQSARLFRRIEYLSVIANIAPMIGLLGTVIGMIFAFQEVALSQGEARAADLATGIYQALVTTVGGLLVAIPSLAAFAIFRNRLDQLVAEGSYMAQHLFTAVRRQNEPRPATATRAAQPAPPPPPPVGSETN